MDATDGTPLAEAGRLMTVCNSCRYCEGLCAVFPAMELRRIFTPGALNHLANLCHGCGACLDDCQFAPPHDFAVNVPRTLSALRTDSYAAYAWPHAAAGAFRCNGLVIALAAMLGVAAFVLGMALADGSSFWTTPLAVSGSFYRLMPHPAMVGVFGAAFLYALLAIALGVRAFWRDSGAGRTTLPAVWTALRDAARLRYLDGGGAGCPDDERTPRDNRRAFHHLTFYGFLLCFASTCVATLYHYVLHLEAPYPWYQPPVVLGTLGGLGLSIGAAGLWFEKHRRRPDFADPWSGGMEMAFILILLLLGVTGLALLALRATPLAGILLAVHLGVVFGFFVTMPYGKFMHAFYRLAALVRHAQEMRAL